MHAQQLLMLITTVVVFTNAQASQPASLCTPSSADVGSCPPTPAEDLNAHLYVPRSSTMSAATDDSRVAANDFNQFVNGEFLATATIPDDQTRWGSFMVLHEDNLNRCRAILEDDPTSLIGRIYAKAMTTPDAVDPAFAAAIAEVSSVTDAISYLAAASKMLTAWGTSPVVHVCKSEDSKNPELRVPHVSQHGLGLPDKSYYTDRVDIHEAYAAYVKDICAIFGVADVDGAGVLAFEKTIAEAHLDRAQRRDPDLTYNKQVWKDLDFGPFFASLPLHGRENDMTYAIVENPKLLAHTLKALGETDAATLRAHLVFTLADNFAPYATQAAVDCHFEFRGKTLSGQRALKPQWKRALALVEKLLGDEIGKQYVARHFPKEKQAECAAMVGDLKEALGRTLQGLDWMAAETKVEAERKLSRFGVKIGVPEEWHSIEGLWDGVDTAAATLPQLLGAWYEWDWRAQEVAKFYTGPERKLWHMTPQTVNAYYHPEMNEIVFPAGILQPPFFGHGTYEENVGAIGVVIGHEMTHGFDDQGRKYASDGSLRDWWTESDAAEFDKRAATVRDHFGSLKVQDKPVNGQLTLGENIADIGGLKLALRALEIRLGGKDAVTQDHLKRFFVAYGGIWRMLVRPETELKLLAIDPHSPCHLRINAALAHIPEFYDTFGVKEGDGMFLDQAMRMNIW